MNERDKLGKLLFTLPVSDRAADTAPEIMVLCDEAAEAILDAGYRKPRTITTAAELDALPGATVVKDALGQVFEKQEAGQWHDGPHDLLSFEGTFWDVDAIHLPATVLYEPEAQP